MPHPCQAFQLKPQFLHGLHYLWLMKEDLEREQMPQPCQAFQVKLVADPPLLQLNSSLSGEPSDVLLHFWKQLEIWWSAPLSTNSELSPPFSSYFELLPPFCPLPSFCGGAAASGFKPPRRAPAPNLWCLHYCKVFTFSSSLIGSDVSIFLFI